MRPFTTAHAMTTSSLKSPARTTHLDRTLAIAWVTTPILVALMVACGAKGRRRPAKGSGSRATRAGPCAPAAGDLDALLRTLRAAGDSPEASTLYAALQTLARYQVQLVSRGRHFPAHDVQLCRQISGPVKWRCRPNLLGHGDDSLHVTEFPPYAVVTFDRSDPVRFADASGRPPGGRLKVAAGEPGHLHARGYEAVNKLQRDAEGRLELAPILPGEPQLLFVIAQPRPDLAIKYTWIVRLLK